MRRPGRHSGGFTILELILVMSLIAGLAVIVSMGIRRVRRSDLRNDTTRVAQSLRMAYNFTALTGKHHRVVFDLEQQKWWIEVCEGNVVLHKERRENLKKGQDIDQARFEQAKAFLSGAGGPTDTGLSGLTGDFVPQVQESMSPEEAAEKAAALAGASIGRGQCTIPTKVGPDGKERPDKRATPKSIKTGLEIEIERIFVQHLQDPVQEKEGVATINFFPMGYSEKAVIELTDNDDGYYTVLVHGLTGQVELKGEKLRDPGEHMMRDGVGKRVEEREVEDE